MGPPSATGAVGRHPAPPGPLVTQFTSFVLRVQFPEGRGARPLQTVAKLLVFRNTIAHGRSREIKAKPETRNADDRLDAYLGITPLTDWERLIQTSDFAERASEDVQAVLERLHERRRDKKEALFTFGIGLHGAILVEEP